MTLVKVRWILLMMLGVQTIYVESKPQTSTRLILVPADTHHIDRQRFQPQHQNVYHQRVILPSSPSQNQPGPAFYSHNGVVYVKDNAEGEEQPGYLESIYNWLTGNEATTTIAPGGQETEQGATPSEEKPQEAKPEGVNPDKERPVEPENPVPEQSEETGSSSGEANANSGETIEAAKPNSGEKKSNEEELETVNGPKVQTKFNDGAGDQDSSVGENVQNDGRGSVGQKAEKKISEEPRDPNQGKKPTTNGKPFKIEIEPDAELIPDSVKTTSQNVPETPVYPDPPVTVGRPGLVPIPGQKVFIVNRSPFLTNNPFGYPTDPNPFRPQPNFRFSGIPGGPQSFLIFSPPNGGQQPLQPQQDGQALLLVQGRSEEDLAHIHAQRLQVPSNLKTLGREIDPIEESHQNNGSENDKKQPDADKPSVPEVQINFDQLGNINQGQQFVGQQEYVPQLDYTRSQFPSNGFFIQRQPLNAFDQQNLGNPFTNFGSQIPYSSSFEQAPAIPQVFPNLIQQQRSQLFNQIQPEFYSSPQAQQINDLQSPSLVSQERPTHFGQLSSNFFDSPYQSPEPQLYRAGPQSQLFLTGQPQGFGGLQQSFGGQTNIGDQRQFSTLVQQQNAMEVMQKQHMAEAQQELAQNAAQTYQMLQQHMDEMRSKSFLGQQRLVGPQSVLPFSRFLSRADAVGAETSIGEAPKLLQANAQSDDGDTVTIDAKFSTNEDKNEETRSMKVPDDERETGVSHAGPSAVAVAGQGGVAQSAPAATALVGAGGLAQASPVATAIAGSRPR